MGLRFSSNCHAGVCQIFMDVLTCPKQHCPAQKVPKRCDSDFKVKG